MVSVNSAGTGCDSGADLRAARVTTVSGNTSAGMRGVPLLQVLIGVGAWRYYPDGSVPKAAIRYHAATLADIGDSMSKFINLAFMVLKLVFGRMKLRVGGNQRF